MGTQDCTWFDDWACLLLELVPAFGCFKGKTTILGGALRTDTPIFVHAKPSRLPDGIPVPCWRDLAVAAT